MFEAAQYLLRRGRESQRAVEAFLAFARQKKVAGYVGNPFAADFALLALEFAPSQALTLVRAALRSAVPVARGEVAATLAVLDRPWCHRELLSALSECQNRGDSAPLRAALRVCTTLEARIGVEQWEQAHPPEPHLGPGYTWSEVADANADTFLGGQLEKARKWVKQLGSALPDSLEPS